MQAARQSIRALIEETRGMKGTKDEMEIVMNRLDALEDILDRALVSDTFAGVRVSHLKVSDTFVFIGRTVTPHSNRTPAKAATPESRSTECSYIGFIYQPKTHQKAL